MRTVNRFDTKQMHRVAKNSKIIYQFAKYGAKGLSKVNPTLVFIDAVVSLGELFISYSKYRQVQEQNRRLEIEINTLNYEFNNLQKELGLKEKILKNEYDKNCDLIEQSLKNNKATTKQLKLVYTLAKDYFIKMKIEVERYKKEYPYTKETKEIEKIYLESLTAYAETTLEFIGG
ncbi:MAG TPA: hypothetical protein EYG89_05540 [Bacteroidia bacterium]|nr:hypothetical protein [Bacteroidia bacterium]